MTVNHLMLNIRVKYAKIFHIKCIKGDYILNKLAFHLKLTVIIVMVLSGCSTVVDNKSRNPESLQALVEGPSLDSNVDYEEIKEFFSYKTDAHLNYLEVLEQRRNSIMDDYVTKVAEEELTEEKLAYIEDELLPSYRKVQDNLIRIVQYYGTIEFEDLDISYNNKMKELHMKFYEGSAQEFKAILNMQQGTELNRKKQIERSDEQFELAKTLFKEYYILKKEIHS